jgi:DNA-binding transcriptional MerR regulator
MDDGTLYSIGELARRTGLTVKTIRFSSDRGIVAPAGRTPAGYRRYGPGAVARLTLVRTLRELGLGLDVIRKVVERELTLGDVAEQHAVALDVRITTLRLQRAVLAAAARRRPTREELERMHQLAQLSQAERRRLIDGFLDAVFEGLDGGPGCHAAARRSIGYLVRGPVPLGMGGIASQDCSDFNCAREYAVLLLARCVACV